MTKLSLVQCKCVLLRLNLVRLTIAATKNWKLRKKLQQTQTDSRESESDFPLIEILNLIDFLNYIFTWSNHPNQNVYHTITTMASKVSTSKNWLKLNRIEPCRFYLFEYSIDFPSISRDISKEQKVKFYERVWNICFKQICMSTSTKWGNSKLDTYCFF